MYKQTQTSSLDQAAETPPEIMQFIMQQFRLSWDPCPPNYTIDGLSRSWATGAFVNPPFKQCKQWLQKAQAEGTYSVFLLPVTKLHCRYMRSIWPCIAHLTVLSELITFKNYKKPLNKSMALLSINFSSQTTTSGYAYYWEQLPCRTMDGLRAALVGFDVTVITTKPSRVLPALLRRSQFVIIMPSRLDLLVLRRQLNQLDEIIFCPTIKADPLDKDNLWIPPIILTRGVQIASALVGLHPHRIPLQGLSTISAKKKLCAE